MNTRGINTINGTLERINSLWRIVEYDQVSAGFKKGEDPRVIHLPFDLLMSCTSVISELDEVLSIIDMAKQY